MVTMAPRSRELSEEKYQDGSRQGKNFLAHVGFFDSAVADQQHQIRRNRTLGWRAAFATKAQGRLDRDRG